MPALDSFSWPLALILAIPVAGLAHLIFLTVFYHYIHPLSKFPGPFWGGITRLWIAYKFHMGVELATEKRYIDKYGPVIRVTPTMLLVNDSKMLPEIYNRWTDKSDYYLTPSFGPVENVLITRDHKQHSKLRKIMAGPYSFSQVKKLEPLVEYRVDQWLQKIRKDFALTGKPLNFTSWSVFLAYDVISEIGFGAPIGFIEAGEDRDGIVANLHSGLQKKAILNRVYPLVKFLQATGLDRRFFGADVNDNSGLGILMRLRDRLLQQRIKDLEQNKDTSDHADLLQTFLHARSDDGKPLSIPYIKAETLLVLLAGADTTGTSMQGLIHHLLVYPDIYKRLMAEIDDVTRRGLLSKIPKYEEVTEHCPYYVACVREVMRLWPSAPALFPRVVNGSGIHFSNGLFAPPGVEVTANPWLIQRDKELYGPDAESFNPDRWLDPERAKTYLKYSFVFGYGSRVCLGKDIAFLEIYKAPLQFLRLFEPKLVDPKKCGTYTVVGGVAWWKDMSITISERPLVAATM